MKRNASASGLVSTSDPVVKQSSSFALSAVAVISAMIAIWGLGVLSGSTLPLMLLLLAATVAGVLGYMLVFVPGMITWSLGRLDQIWPPEPGNPSNVRRAIAGLVVLLSVAVVGFVAMTFGGASALGVVLLFSLLPTSSFLVVTLATTLSLAALVGLMGYLFYRRYGAQWQSLLSDIAAIGSAIKQWVMAILSLRWLPALDGNPQAAGYGQVDGEDDQAGKSKPIASTSEKKPQSTRPISQYLGWLNSLLVALVVMVLAMTAGVSPLMAVVTAVLVSLIMIAVTRPEAEKVFDAIIDSVIGQSSQSSENQTLVSFIKKRPAVFVFSLVASLMLSTFLNVVMLGLQPNIAWAGAQLDFNLLASLAMLAVLSAGLSVYVVSGSSSLANSGRPLFGPAATVATVSSLLLAVALFPSPSVVLAVSIMATFVVILANGLFFLNGMVSGFRSEKDGSDDEWNVADNPSTSMVAGTSPSQQNQSAKVNTFAFFSAFTLLLGCGAILWAPHRLAALSGGDNLMSVTMPESVVDHPAYLVAMLLLVLMASFAFYGTMVSSQESVVNQAQSALGIDRQDSEPGYPGDEVTL